MAATVPEPVAADGEEIGEIILSKKIPALVGVQDLSTRDVHVELELSRKSGTEPELVMAYLLKNTRLQVTVKFDFTCLVPVPGSEIGRPARLGLAQILEEARAAFARKERGAQRVV